MRTIHTAHACLYLIVALVTDHSPEFYRGLVAVASVQLEPVRVRPVSLPQTLPPLRRPSVIVFGAKWCGPCQRLKAVTDQLKRDKFGVRDWSQFGNARIWTVDVDRYPAIAAKHRVDDVPTVILLDGKTEVDRHIGPMTRAELLAFYRGVK